MKWSVDSRETGKDVVDYLRVGLAGNIGALTENHIKHVRKEMFNQLGSSRLVFVGGYGKAETTLLECTEQFGNTLVRLCVDAVVSVVVRHKDFAQAENSGFVFVSDGQGTLDETIDTVSYKVRVFVQVMLREIKGG